jgi:hypothetical protein
MIILVPLTGGVRVPAIVIGFPKSIGVVETEQDRFDGIFVTRSDRRGLVEYA